VKPVPVIVCSLDPSHRLFNAEICLYARVKQRPNPPDGTGAAPLPGSPYHFSKSSSFVGECADEDCFGDGVLFQCGRQVDQRVFRLGRLSSWDWNGADKSTNLWITNYNAATCKMRTPMNLIDNIRKVIERRGATYVWIDIQEGKYLIGGQVTYKGNRA
jgi:hypothetical protein